MNHAQLRAFHAVVTEGSFTAAAQHLGVSQPAVTMQVRALEMAHGVELFLRRGRRAQPSELGLELADVTRRIAGLEEEASELLARTRELRGGKLRVAADAPNHVVTLLAEFHARHPKVLVALSIKSSSEALRDLLEVRADVAVLADVAPDPRLYELACARHRIVAFVERRHPLSRRRSIRLADLEGCPMVLRERGSITRATFESALAAARVRPRVIMEIESREAVREVVAAGLGVGVVSEAELGQDRRLVSIRIEDGMLDNTEYVVCLEARRRLHAVRAFLGLVAPLAAAARAPRSPGRSRAKRSPRARVRV